MTKPTKIYRDQLYKEIWKEPATKLAERYGISGSMVSRICDELHVPRPAPGHWMKLQYGHKVKIPKLPALEDGQKDHWGIRHTIVKIQRGVQAAKAATVPVTCPGTPGTRPRIPSFLEINEYEITRPSSC